MRFACIFMHIRIITNKNICSHKILLIETLVDLMEFLGSEKLNLVTELKCMRCVDVKKIKTLVMLDIF